MTDKEFEYVPRFDWERETALSRRQIAVHISLWFIAPAALWTAIIIGIASWRPLPGLLP